MTTKKTVLLKGAALALIAGAAFVAFHRESPRRMARVVLTFPEGDVARLTADGYEVIAVDHDRKWADVLAEGPELVDRLDTYGFEVLAEEDLGTDYGPDRDYKTPEEIEQTLRDYVQRFPHLVTLRSIGKSGEGKDIWAVKLTADGYVDILTKPVVLFNAMHHAREVMSPEIALDTIDYLVTGFNQDPKVTHWLANNEIWVLPMVNPDGNAKVWGSDSMWRKNTHGGHGVDINRNYPNHWGACNGSSGSKSSDTYRGSHEGSEAETQAMMRFVTEIRPVFDISYHSYGEIVIYPYGCDGQRTPKSDVVEMIGKEIAQRIPTDSGSGTYKPGTAWELLYAVDGSDIDWMYDELHVIPFVIEVNSGFANGGFQPPFAKRAQTVKNLRGGWTYLLDRLDGPGVRGRITNAQGQPFQGATVTVRSTTEAALAEQTYNVGPDGVYHLVLRSGTYTIVLAAGGQSVEKTVTIGATRKSLSVRL